MRAQSTTLAAGGQTSPSSGKGSRDRKPAPAASPVRPTAERLAKVAEALEDETLTHTKPYRIRSIIDQYASHFTMDEAHTAAMFLKDAEAATRVNITSSYQGMSSVARGSRTGGVGSNDRLREAHRRHTLLWQTLPPKTREVLTALVLEVRAESTGKVVSVQEMGHLMTRFKDKATARGVGIGLLKASLWAVEWLMRTRAGRT